MNAREALLAYGYQEQGDGSFLLFGADGNVKSHRWVPVQGGYHRFDRRGLEWVHTLHHANEQGQPDFTWPDEEVANIYATAIASRG